MTEKKIIIIAGPNGAGKTTFAIEFLPHEAACPNFVNADLIAAGLAPFASEIRHHVRLGESFAFETTLSGRHYAQLIPSWQSAGYSVKLFFLNLASPDGLARAGNCPGSATCQRGRAQYIGASDSAAFFRRVT